MRSRIILTIAILISGCATSYRDAAELLLETDWVAGNVGFVPVWEHEDNAANDPRKDFDGCLKELEQMKYGFASTKNTKQLSGNTKKLQILNCMSGRGWQLVPSEVVVTK